HRNLHWEQRIGGRISVAMRLRTKLRRFFFKNKEHYHGKELTKKLICKKTVKNVPALIPPSLVRIGRAKLTLITLPYNSARFILSIAACASSGSSNSTNPNPRC